MDKKAIAVIYSPKSLFNFIWYYSSFGKEYEWDVVIRPYGKDSDKSILNTMQIYVKKMGIFKNIIIDFDNEIFQSVGDKVKLLIQMMGYCIVKKQRTFCEKYINKRFRLDDYSLILTSCESGTLEGTIIGVSDEHNVVILEDGTLDYKERKEKLDFRDLFKFWNLVGYILSVMGYGNTHSTSYKLDKTKFCDKFASKPELLKDCNFKSISALNDMTLCDKDLYKGILDRIFAIPTGLDKADVMLSTFPYTDYVKDDSFVKRKVEDYINQNYLGKTILLKKHPRDLAKYNFDKSINVVNVEQTIPAELLITYSEVGTYVFTWPSTFIFAMDSNKNKIEVLYFEQVKEENKQYKLVFDECLETLDVKKECVVKID